MQMKQLIFYALCIYVCAGCGTSHFLKPCQQVAIERLGKGLSAVGSNSPDLHLKLYDITEENKLNSYAVISEVHKRIKSPADTSYKTIRVKGQPDKIDTIIKKEVIDTSGSNIEILTWIDSSISKKMADSRSLQLTEMEKFRSAWSLCNRYSELILAVANPELSKTLKTAADSWKPAVDSLVSKYNSFFPTATVNANFGKLFSSIALHFGTRKIKKEQKKYVEQAMDTGNAIITRILETIKDPILKSVNGEIETLQNNYSSNYTVYQGVINKDVIDASKAKDLIKELTKIKVSLGQLQKLQQKLVELCKHSKTLFGELHTSLKTNEDCKNLTTLTADSEKMTILLQEIDIINSSLK